MYVILRTSIVGHRRHKSKIIIVGINGGNRVDGNKVAITYLKLMTLILTVDCPPFSCC